MRNILRTFARFLALYVSIRLRRKRRTYGFLTVAWLRSILGLVRNRMTTGQYLFAVAVIESSTARKRRRSGTGR